MENKYLEILKDLEVNGETKLKRSVASIVIKDCKCNLEDYIRKTLYYCDTNSLTSDKDTKKFFIEHTTDIFDLYEKYKHDTSEYPFIGEEINEENLAWFGFSYELDKLGIDLNLDFF